LWHDRAVFHFLTDPEDRARYLHTLDKALKPGGQVIIATFAPDGPEKCSGLEIVQYDANRLMAELGGEFELLQTITEQHHTPMDTLQKFIYFRVRRR